jgi:ribosomal protein S18 acetylase RimI-like enzyme
MDDIDIRVADEADVDDILAMLKSLAEETGDGERFSCRAGDIRDHGFGARPMFECLLAARAERSLGLALYFPIFSTTRGCPGVYLQDIWIAPDCRDVGLGTRLMRRVVERAAKRWQAAYLDLMVHGHNEGADRYYRRHGFEERGDDRHLTLEGDAFQALLATV